MSKNQSTSNAPSNKVSVTFRVDKGVLEHNNRTFIAKNVVRERVPDNIIYKHLKNITQEKEPTEKLLTTMSIC